MLIFYLVMNGLSVRIPLLRGEVLKLLFFFDNEWFMMLFSFSRGGILVAL